MVLACSAKIDSVLRRISFIHFSKNEHLSKSQTWRIWEVWWLSPGDGLLQWNQKLSSWERGRRVAGEISERRTIFRSSWKWIFRKNSPKEAFKRGNTNFMFCLVFLYLCCRLSFQIFMSFINVKKYIFLFFIFLIFISFYIFVAGCWWSMKNIWGTLWRRWI